MMAVGMSVVFPGEGEKRPMSWMRPDPTVAATFAIP